MIRKYKTILITTIALLMATISYAGIEPTSGRYIESNTDLSIKVIGGHISWERDYRDFYIKVGPNPFKLLKFIKSVLFFGNIKEMEEIASDLLELYGKGLNFQAICDEPFTPVNIGFCGF